MVLSTKHSLVFCSKTDFVLSQIGLEQLATRIGS